MLVSVAGLTSSCSLITDKKEEKLKPEDFAAVEINNQYKLSLPKYMTEAKNLSDEASLQYQNVFKETYTTVIDESRQEVIDSFIEFELYDTTLDASVNYRNIQLGMIEEKMKISSKSEPVALKIGGLNAQQVQIDGHVEDIPQEISYLFTFIEGDEHVYMITSWTLKARKEKYLKTFQEISNSFRLL